MPRASADEPFHGIGRGDRVLYLGLGQRHGQHADTLSTRRVFASVCFDDGVATLCLVSDLHPIPRRPPPMW